MKKYIIFAVVIFFGFASNLDATSINVRKDNIVSNSTFEDVSSSGIPVGWFNSKSGQNDSFLGRIKCTYYTNEDILNNGQNVQNYYDTIHRPGCPPETRYRLFFGIGNYIDGYSGTYFKDVAIKFNKEYEVLFDYQAYTSRAEAFVRYTMHDGSYTYSELGKLLPLELGGNGYVRWLKSRYKINPPKKAKSLTVFFIVRGNEGCIHVPCLGPERGEISISNVIVRELK